MPDSPRTHIVQIFGIKKSPATRAAERFFKERRVPIQSVDLNRKPMSAGEINRFIGRFGLDHLLDKDGAAYVNGGLKYLKMSERELLEKIERNPALLRLPLVRCSARLSAGRDEAAWAAMLAPAGV